MYVIVHSFRGSVGVLFGCELAYFPWRDPERSTLRNFLPARHAERAVGRAYF
jgi:hypothetical protein